MNRRDPAYDEVTDLLHENVDGWKPARDRPSHTTLDEADASRPPPSDHPDGESAPRSLEERI